MEYTDYTVFNYFQQKKELFFCYFENNDYFCTRKEKA